MFTKTGFRLAVNFEDIWLIMIGSVYDRVEVFICGVSVEASRQREIGFQQNKKATIVSG